MASNKKLSATITIGGALSGTLATAFGKVKGIIGEFGKSISDAEKRQKLLGKSIQEFGRAGKNVDGMRERYTKLTADIDRARKAQERLVKAQAFKAKSEKIGGALNGAAIRAGATGAAIGGVLYTGIHAAIERENSVNVIRNSGVSKGEADAMVKAAQDSKQFGVSVTKATDTVSELRTALGDAHHAIEALPTTLKALSGLQLYNRGHKNQIGEDAAYSLAKIAEERGGASSPEALRDKQNWAFKALTGSNGVVSADDQLTAIRRGKGAVAAMDDRSFFGDTFLMQAMSANGYGTASSTLMNAWIGGHQTHGAFDHMMQLGLLNRGGVKFDKTGKVKTVSPDALVENQLFLKDPQAWVDKHLAPILQKQGIDPTDLNNVAAVTKFANSIASNPNAANIVLQRLRFSKSIAKDRHNVDIANGVDESNQANINSTAGKVDNAQARLNDAQSRVGTILVPAFATAMEKVADVLEDVNKFAEENPRLMKAMVMGLGGLAIGLVAVTPVLLAANGILQTIAIVRLAGATAQVTGLVNAMTGIEGAAAGAAGGIGSVLGLLARAAGIAGAVVAVANMTTNQEDDELKDGPAKWAALRAKYPKSIIDAARKENQPWYQFGDGYAGENEDWINKYMAKHPDAAKKLPTLPSAGRTGPAGFGSNDTYTFNITQQPGQDGKALADSIIQRMNQKQGVKNRSIMFDGATQ